MASGLVAAYLIGFLVLRYVVLPPEGARRQRLPEAVDRPEASRLARGTLAAAKRSLVIGLVHHHRLVLDAWVAKHIGEARKKFEESLTYQDRRLYVALPVVLNGRTIRQLGVEDLRPTCRKDRWSILIRGGRPGQDYARLPDRLVGDGGRPFESPL